MAVIKCKMCGGDIALNEEKTFGTCEYCGSTMTLPKVSDDQRAALFNRGNHFRRAGEFDKALDIYENIVREDDSDAEAHWCCALCRFGIEYVEDPNTYEFIPTCHRASFDSFLEDVDYLAALEYSDGITRRQYQKDGAKIAEVQKGILATSKNEEPFDVFICYKETDDNTKERTKDSLDAQEIYYQLTNEGYRVFFSRITLEDKVGAEYEPYIFAALNSTKVMVAIGSKPEYFNAVWVKNEWSRFLALMRKDRSKLLLPCYKNMDPYDLPEQLSVLQSYDMSKIGFIQDLIRGIKKVIKQNEQINSELTVVQQSTLAASVDPLLKRTFMFLEDGEWDNANEYAEKVLDQDPEQAMAYVAKLMVELKVKKQAELENCENPFAESIYFKKAVRFGSKELKAELYGYNTHIEERNNNEIYDRAVRILTAAKTEYYYKKASELFLSVKGWKDADSLLELCLKKADESRLGQLAETYNCGIDKMNVANSEEEFLSAKKEFDKVHGFRDADILARECCEKAEGCRKTIEISTKKRIAAIVTALKNGDTAGLSHKEKLSESKNRIGALVDLLDEFDAFQKQASQLDENQNAILLQEIRLKEQRSKLGLFASKEKKEIDNKLSSITEEKNRISAQSIQLKQKARGYFSKADIERDIAEERKKAYDLEAKIDGKAANSDMEYSYKEALKLYLSDPGISKAVNKIYPGASIIAARHGNTSMVLFGRYIQKKNGAPEPIEWTVLARENNRLLLISKYALDSQIYYKTYGGATMWTPSWKSCTLRKWLNQTFFNAAFCQEEQKKILTSSDTYDKVFILSTSDAYKYFRSDKGRICFPTEYAISHGAYTQQSIDGDITCCWWLRTHGTQNNYAAYVNENGSLNHSGIIVDHVGFAVRPALWINADSK